MWQRRQDFLRIFGRHHEADVFSALSLSLHCLELDHFYRIRSGDYLSYYNGSRSHNRLCDIRWFHRMFNLATVYQISLLSILYNLHNPFGPPQFTQCIEYQTLHQLFSLSSPFRDLLMSCQYWLKHIAKAALYTISDI